MPLTITKPDGTKIVPKTMRELMEIVSPKFYFCLAARTAFVFIGTAEEFKRDADLLDQPREKKSDDYIPLMDRKITGYRKRDVPGEAPHMVLIEGNDFGPFWLRCEYEEFLQCKGVICSPPRKKERST